MWIDNSSTQTLLCLRVISFRQRYRQASVLDVNLSQSTYSGTVFEQDDVGLSNKYVNLLVL